MRTRQAPDSSLPRPDTGKSTGRTARAARAVKAFTRRDAIRRVMRKMNKGYPRLQMFLIVLLTGAAGLASSYWLLRTGVDSMATRYPFSVGCAYLVFLVLLWLWLRTRGADYLMDANFDLLLPRGGETGAAGPAFSGGGGHSGGGGASGSFDDASSSFTEVPGGDAAGKVGEVVANADEAAVPIAVVLLVAAIAASLLFATFYIVYLAPALFAEMVVDGVLSAHLYRRMRRVQTRFWLESAVRRTVLPFAAVALVLSAAGFALNLYAPQAHSLGQVLEHSRMPKQ